MKLVLKKLFLRNWGKFYGENLIEFSDDPVKNITYILGKSGSGKTNLLNALDYCLFQELKNNTTILNFLNKQAIDENEEDVEMALSLKFHVVLNSKATTIYEIFRTWLFERELLSSNIEFQNPERFIGRKSNNGTWHGISQIDFMKEINSIISPVNKKNFFLETEILQIFPINTHMRKIANYLIRNNEEIENEIEARGFIQMKFNEFYSKINNIFPQNGILKINENWDFELFIKNNLIIPFGELAKGHKTLITIIYLLTTYLGINNKHPIIFDGFSIRIADEAKIQFFRFILDTLGNNQIVFLLNEMEHKILNPILENRIIKSYKIQVNNQKSLIKEL